MDQKVKDLYLIKLGTHQWRQGFVYVHHILMRQATLDNAIRSLKIRKVPWDEPIRQGNASGR